MPCAPRANHKRGHPTPVPQRPPPGPTLVPPSCRESSLLMNIRTHSGRREVTEWGRLKVGSVFIILLALCLAGRLRRDESACEIVPTSPQCPHPPAGPPDPRLPLRTGSQTARQDPRAAGPMGGPPPPSGAPTAAHCPPPPPSTSQRGAASGKGPSDGWTGPWGAQSHQLPGAGPASPALAALLTRGPAAH